MELNQLEKLIDHVGNFVNNYTPEQFKHGILREQSKSDVVAGMTLAMTVNHDLSRLQSIACFGIKELQENLFYQKYNFPNSRTATSLFPEHFLTKAEAESCNYEIKTYDMWVKSWHGYQLFLQFLLGPSYRDIIATIINDIQQNNVGQLFDIEYLLILTATMRALLFEYSSSTTAFTVHDSTLHLPADMTTSDWQIVIQKLWMSFKEKLSFTMQQEFLLVRSKYPITRIKPFSGKVAKEVVPGKVVAQAKDKKNNKSPDAVVKKGKVDRKVAFPADDLRICVSDLAKHYRVRTDLEACDANCRYTHYDKLPADLTAKTILDKVNPILEKLNLAENQLKFFINKIKADPKFK